MGSDAARRGRPPVDEDDPCVDVHVRMPSKQYDETFKLAQRERKSVPELIRLVVQQRVNKKT